MRDRNGTICSFPYATAAAAATTTTTIFVCVLFRNYIIFVILKADVCSTDYLNYLPIDKTHQSVLKCNPFSMANQSIKQPTNQPTNQNQQHHFNLQKDSTVLTINKTCITVSWVIIVLQSGRQTQGTCYPPLQGQALSLQPSIQTH